MWDILDGDGYKANVLTGVCLNDKNNIELVWLLEFTFKRTLNCQINIFDEKTL
jgi:hypothetical protein